jgi:hypothetical protein
MPPTASFLWCNGLTLDDGLQSQLRPKLLGSSQGNLSIVNLFLLLTNRLSLMECSHRASDILAVCVLFCFNEFAGRCVTARGESTPSAINSGVFVTRALT